MNPDPVEALDKLFELVVRLGEEMQRDLGERGLSASRAELLLVLEQGGAMVQRQLSEALRCTPRHVTTLIDALEAQGLVKRSPHPTDRRATLVSLTKRGAAAAARMGSERQQAARWLLGDVSPTDLATFVAIANQVLGRIGAAPPGETSRERKQSDAGRETQRAESPARTRRQRVPGTGSPSQRAQAEPGVE